MKKPAILMWSTAGLLSLFMLCIGGGWWALRTWPEESSPYVPAWLAWQLADVGKSEFKVAERVFRIDRQYDLKEMPINRNKIKEREAIILQGLHSSRSSQLLALRLMHSEDAYVSHKEIKEQLFTLTQSTDEEIRFKARNVWLYPYDAGFKHLSQLSIDSANQEKTPLTPDNWIPSKEAVIALRLFPFMSAGYDHITPHKYHKKLREDVTLLQSLPINDDRFANDHRDNALIINTLAELFAMTNDKDLKPLLQKAMPSVVNDTTKLSQLWGNDTTTAILTTLCLKSLIGSGIDHEKGSATLTAFASLKTGLKAWLSQFKTSELPPWMSHGKIIPASELERWGIISTAQYFTGCTPPLLHPTSQHPIDPATLYAFSRYIYYSGLFVNGEKKCVELLKQHQKLLLNTRILTPDHSGNEGRWPARANVSSDMETIFSTLELSLYHRRPWLD